MRVCKLIVFCLFYYVCSAKEEDVLDLGDVDFDARLAEHETALVMFYAPWCGHCKKLKPEYAKAAEDLVRNDPPVALVKVDCTEAGKETCNKNSVSGYPTLKIYRKGQVSQDYQGPRDAAGIVKYMRAQVGPSSKDVKTMKELDEFLAADTDPSILGLFPIESELKAAFMKTADKLREKFRFAHSSSKEVLAKQEGKEAIIVMRPKHLDNKFEESEIYYRGRPDVEDIKLFIAQNLHGLVGHRKTDNKQEFHNPMIVAYYNVDYVKNPKGTNYWRNRMLKVAHEYGGKLSFAISAKDDFQHELNEFGLDYIKGDKPVITARNKKNQKFIMKDDFSVEALTKFVKDVEADKLEPYLKSEPIPDNNDGPVKVAVAKNFDELVLNNEKDVLIEFYAPWCGHCKKLAPAFDELGEKMKNENVLIIKMDATANDVPPPYDVRGFPTLYWAQGEGKDTPVRYEGGREVDDFIRYIAKHSTRELKGYDREGNAKPDKTEL